MSRFLRRSVAAVALALLALLGVLLWNAFQPPAPAPAVRAPAVVLDAETMARRLASALSIATVSQAEGETDLSPFADLHALLQREFPRVHAQLPPERHAGASLLYHWPGRRDCAPLILLAHQDVVPVEPGTETQWRHPPFAGVIAEDAIWGRGAIDNKSALLAILEAVERLLQRGYQPECPVWLAFGHDEEVGGRGAQALAARLIELGVKDAWVLDEGGAITQGSVPGLAPPLASIGVAEKGYLSLRLSAEAGGGHSSMPPPRTAIGRLATAIAQLEAQRPAAHFSAVQRELLARIAPYMPFPRRLLLSNLWLTAPLVADLLAQSPATDATLRTTTAPTLFQAGVKDNVLPQRAEAVVNFRIRPGDSIAGVIEHVRRVVDDPEVQIAPTEGFSSEPTAPSPWDDPAFTRIETALRAVSPEPELIVAPYVTNGATDARHYAVLSTRLYRLLPARLDPELLASFHGSNERLPIAEYLRMVRFYLALLAADSWNIGHQEQPSM